MKIDGTAPTQGPEGRRFQAAKSNPAQAGGKSFGALLKKAAAAAPAPVPSAPAQAAGPSASSALPASPPASSEASLSEAKAEAKAEAETAPAPTDTGSKATKKRPESDSADFANHMEMVKLRLKSGYYNNTNVDDALSEKLTGFFDDLA